MLVDEHCRAIARWAVFLAARPLETAELPAVTTTDLSQAELLALKLALNRISEEATWHDGVLALELTDIMEFDPTVEIEATDFEIGEVDEPRGCSTRTGGGARCRNRAAPPGVDAERRRQLGGASSHNS